MGLATPALIWEGESMKVLLDTNIVIHREAATVINEDIGILFRWLDDLSYVKCVHPVTVQELGKHQDPKVRKSLEIKLASYNVLKTQATLAENVEALSDQIDENENDRNDTRILNEVFKGRVDLLITEDKALLKKSSFLGIADRVYTIDAFLEKVTAENPGLADYKVLSIQKEYFGNLDIDSDFLASFIQDYQDFDKWFQRKADEPVYVCHSNGHLVALLYLKSEKENENYSEIDPIFQRKKRLKIGTLKVTMNGYRLGERLLKIVFDNALLLKVDEIYVTIFDTRIEHHRLMNLLEEYGFHHHGYKHTNGQRELVYVRSFAKKADHRNPKRTFPFFSTSGRTWIVPIYPKYHTELFPDSILQTESPTDFVENEPHRNAISKVYISRSIERGLNPGDVIVFYRTGGYYKGVASTIGIVERVVDNISNVEEFVRLCRKRSVFSDEELVRHWDYNRRYRPFIVDFLYAYSFPKRIILKRLIELGVIRSVTEVPRGFTEISTENLRDILRECQADESIAIG